MRTRLLITGMALGATVLLGGVATAQTTPEPSQVGTTSTDAAAGSWVREGVYRESTCYSRAASYAGPAYCTPVGGGKFALYIWVD